MWIVHRAAFVPPMGNLGLLNLYYKKIFKENQK